MNWSWNRIFGFIEEIDPARPDDGLKFVVRSQDRSRGFVWMPCGDFKGPIYYDTLREALKAMERLQEEAMHRAEMEIRAMQRTLDALQKKKERWENGFRQGTAEALSRLTRACPDKFADRYIGTQQTGDDSQSCWEVERLEDWFGVSLRLSVFEELDARHWSDQGALMELRAKLAGYPEFWGERQDGDLAALEITDGSCDEEMTRYITFAEWEGPPESGKWHHCDSGVSVLDGPDDRIHRMWVVNRGEYVPQAAGKEQG